MFVPNTAKKLPQQRIRLISNRAEQRFLRPATRQNTKSDKQAEQRPRGIYWVDAVGDLSSFLTRADHRTKETFHLGQTIADDLGNLGIMRR